MSLGDVARRHYQTRARLSGGVERAAARLWGRVDRARISDSWAALVPDLDAVVTAAQQAAAEAANDYVAAALAEQGLPGAASGRLNPAALAGIASDGRDLAVLLNQPSLTALAGLRQGYTIDEAMTAGQASVRMIAATQVADAGRAADAVASTSRRSMTGYRRMLASKGCSRCVILAGRWYATNEGFDRHPKCRCVHVPGREDTTEDVRTNPRRYFESLTADEQDRVFTKAGAESIRLGADMNQVVNARRGAAGLTPAGARITSDQAQALRGGRRRGQLEMVDAFGRQLFVTTEGVTTRVVAGRRIGARDTGVRPPGERYRSARPPRLMPESILQIAGDDRDEAIRLLHRFGYIL